MNTVSIEFKNARPSYGIASLPVQTDFNCSVLWQYTLGITSIPQDGYAYTLGQRETCFTDMLQGDIRYVILLQVAAC